MKYDLEADFFLTRTCNFRCPYCRFWTGRRGEERGLYGTISQWQDGFDAAGKTCLIHATGGEPFSCSDFVGLCERLARRHFLSVNSNLAYRSVEDFAQRIHPSRVHYIHASVHYEERQRRDSLDAFAARVRMLRDAQFNVLVSQVMTPHMVDNFPAVSADLESRGLSVIPKILRGGFEGKRYPEGYSPEHKDRLREYIAEARLKYAGVMERMGEPPTLNMFSDSDFLNGLPAYHGKWCGAGCNFLTINEEGVVFRCGSRQQLGNLLLKTVRLLNGPQRCETSYCHYFCEKYTSARFLRGQSSCGIPAPRTPGNSSF